MILALTACAPPASPPTPPAATRTPTPPPSATPTVVWFPPTPTYTPFPTPEITPTSELRPGVGALLLADDFSDPSEWTLPATAAGRASIRDHALTIALVEPRTFLLSPREGPVLEDFYAEITAETSLCMGMDEYGLAVRLSGGVDYYRYSLSCDGQARLDRIHSGSAGALQPWTFEGGAPVSAPGRVRLAVWARGEEMRFFANDQFQFAVRDPLIPQGTLGVFARAAGDSAVTVSFSDLEVRSLESDS